MMAVLAIVGTLVSALVIVVLAYIGYAVHSIEKVLDSVQTELRDLRKSHEEHLNFHIQHSG